MVNRDGYIYGVVNLSLTQRVGVNILLYKNN